MPRVASRWLGRARVARVALQRRAPLRVPALAIAVFGAGAAAGVAYLASQNPEAQPMGASVLVRVLIIGSLTTAAVYARTSALHRRMGLLLTGACVLSSLWLLNGSSSPFAFSLGALLSGPALVAAYYLLLAYPSGTLRPGPDARFLGLAGGATVALWVVSIVTGHQPPVRTPLLACMPHCPKNAFFIGFSDRAVAPELRTAYRVGWLTVTFGVPLLLLRRWRSAATPLRRSLLPVLAVSCVAALLLVAFLTTHWLGAHGTENTVGAAYVSMWAAIPLAIFAGFAAERLFMGQALAQFVSELAHDEDADPSRLMATTLQAPSLSIVYARPASGGYVEFSGAPATPPGSAPGSGVTWIERSGRPIAAVVHDDELADQQRFIQAAGDAAVMRLEQAQLLADLRASTADLAASRLRLVETAQAERQRIERDLHDSVQQDLLGLRLRLDLATEAVGEDPVQARHMIAGVGRQLDGVLDSVRALARGVYPRVLRDHGLVEAVRSAGRRSPLPVAVRATSIRRYHEDVEVAVYFCCLEGLQNSAKHAGPSAASEVRFWQDEKTLRFEIADSGAGFDPGLIVSSNGLASMHDRIEAVGGSLTITSRQGQGTVVRGRIPAQPLSGGGEA